MQPSLERALIEWGKMLQGFFQVKSLCFADKNKKGEAEVLKPAVLDRSKGVSDFRLKLGLDGGRGFLKAYLNITDEQQTQTQSSGAKKLPIRGDRFLDSGVKCLFIVGIVHNIPEKYENLKLLPRELKVSFCLATDLKLCIILAGLQCHC